jgi:NADH dehydrogenase
MARGAERSRIVVVGAGFGGLTAARALAKLDVDVTVVDRRNHHLFQPLLYQVAIAGLGSNDIAAPIRAVLSDYPNVRVLLGEVESIDVDARRLRLRDGAIDYDVLVVASGARTSYFGHDDWERFAPGLKSIEDALEIRRRVLLAFERAERAAFEGRSDEVAALLTFAVIGGGPTGVELAGAIAELARTVLRRDFRSIDPSQARVVAIEAGPCLLPAMPAPLPARAAEQLTSLGVELRLRHRVTAIDEHGLELAPAEGAPTRLAAATVVWAAGVSATPLGATLGAPVDRQGRVEVGPDLSAHLRDGRPDVFVIGDAASFLHDPSSPGKPLPGLSPVAMQQARHVAKNVKRLLDGATTLPFRYVDKGSMATIGRSRAVAAMGRLRLGGLVAWLAWLLVHVFYLIDFRNRVAVMMEWAWSYLTFRRGARIIAEHREAPLTEVGRLP